MQWTVAKYTDKWRWNVNTSIVYFHQAVLAYDLTCASRVWFCRKVIDLCENFKEDPMETNQGQEGNYGQRGWNRRTCDSWHIKKQPSLGSAHCHHFQGHSCAAAFFFCFIFIFHPSSSFLSCFYLFFFLLLLLLLLLILLRHLVVGAYLSYPPPSSSSSFFIFCSCFFLTL